MTDYLKALMSLAPVPVPEPETIPSPLDKLIDGCQDPAKTWVLPGAAEVQVVRDLGCCKQCAALLGERHSLSCSEPGKVPLRSGPAINNSVGVPPGAPLDDLSYAFQSGVITFFQGHPPNFWVSRTPDPTSFQVGVRLYTKTESVYEIIDEFLYSRMQLKQAYYRLGQVAASKLSQALRGSQSP